MVGHKVGPSSPIMQQMMGADESDWRTPLDDAGVRRHAGPGVPAPVSGLRWRCFILPPTYRGDGHRGRRARATEALRPPSSRSDTQDQGLQIKICDTIADKPWRRASCWARP